MIGLAVNGITSLSIQPIRLVTIFGIVAAFIGFIGMAWSLINWLVGSTVSGWASLAVIICFFGGVQMLSLGIIGEYVGKTYLEAKRRPRFIIAERVGGNE